MRAACPAPPGSALTPVNRTGRPGFRQGGQQGLQPRAAAVGGQGLRVPGGEDEVAGIIHVEGAKQVGARQGRRGHQQVQPRRSGEGDAPVLFTHADQAGRGGFGGREVQMGQFGDGVPEGVVHGAEGQFSAVEVGDDRARQRGRARRRQGLVAIAGQDDHVGPLVGQHPGEGGGEGAHAAAQIGGAVAAHVGGDTAGAHAVILDQAVGAERIVHHHGQCGNPGLVQRAAHDRRHGAVGAGDGDHADRSCHVPAGSTSVQATGSSGWSARVRRRPIRRGRSSGGAPVPGRLQPR